MCDQQMSTDIAKSLIKGDADPLNSQFRLTYNMILNLLRVEGVEPDFILKKSFFHFQNQLTLPDMHQRTFSCSVLHVINLFNFRYQRKG